MSSRVSERVAPSVVPKQKVEADPKLTTPAPSPSRPTGWSAPSDKVNDGWKNGTAPRPSIAPPSKPLSSDAPVLSLRELQATQPPPAAAPPAMSRVLKKGASGEDVRALQQRLSELGFETSPSGKFDARTEAAVKSFQGSRGLKVDGDAGRDTFRALGLSFGAAAPSGGGTSVNMSRVLKPGTSGDDVRALQQRLNVAVTGSYDRPTERAVEAFQRGRGLSADGDAGRDTLTALGFTFGRSAAPADVPAQITRPTITPRPEIAPRPEVTPRIDVTPRPHVEDATHVHDDTTPHVHDTPSTPTPAQPTTIATGSARYGDVRERQAIAARIVERRGVNTTQADVDAVVTEVAKLPLDQLRDLERARISVVACRDSVVDAVPSLATEQPRGWAPGRSWADVPGAYNPGSREVIIATRESASGGREVPPFGAKHGSVSLVAHEAGHAVDHARGYPSRENADFQRAYQSDLRGAQLLPYYTQTGDAGPSEAYAESLALFLSGDKSGDGARRFPAMMQYWESQYAEGSAS